VVECAFFSRLGHNLRNTFIQHTGILNGLLYCNSVFSRLISNNFSTSHRNLVGFGSVTPEFTTLEGVKQVSIILLELV